MRILLGSIAFLDEGEEPGITSPDYVVFRTRAGMLHPRFFYHWLRSNEGAAFVRTLARGAVRERMLFRRLSSATIELPPWEAQVTVANALPAVDRARAAAEAQLEAAQALREAWLRRAFHGIVPLCVGTDRAASPRGQSWRKLASLARLESGHTPSRYHPEWWGGSIAWLSLQDIRDLDGKVAYDTMEHTNEDGIANSSARILPAGTVVLSRTASVGFVTIIGRPMATSQDFVNWVCGPELDPYFLAFLFQASRAYIRSLSSGAIHQTVYVPTVQAFEVCVPSLHEQCRIVAELRERISTATRTRESLAAQLAAINALPAALLREAFSGRL